VLSSPVSDSSSITLLTLDLRLGRKPSGSLQEGESGSVLHLVLEFSPGMRVTHHGVDDELLDEWWAEVGMADFIRHSNAYRSTSEQGVFDVCINDVAPVHRNKGVGIFNDSIDNCLTARARVIRILRGFKSSDAIPPVVVADGKPDDPYRYKLIDGVHRLYCSIAAGFTHIPAVEGFDINSPDG
jgi:hypothetical protein